MHIPTPFCFSWRHATENDLKPLKVLLVHRGVADPTDLETTNSKGEQTQWEVSRVQLVHHSALFAFWRRLDFWSCLYAQVPLQGNS